MLIVDIAIGTAAVIALRRLSKRLLALPFYTTSQTEKN